MLGMKGLRDDDDDVYSSNSQSKRPFVSPSYGQSHVPGDGVGKVAGGGGGAGGGSCAKELISKDALTYLKEVKDTFHDQREKYDMFLDVLKDLKTQRADTTGVIARVKELFKGHNHLIFGFSIFLPEGYEITVIDDEEPPPKTIFDFEEAISFVNKIKKRFQYEDHVYESLLDILNMYREEHKGINEVYHEVAALFDNQPDLLDEFTRFLPEASAAATAHRASLVRQSMYRQEFTFCEKVKDRLRNHDHIIAFLKCIHIYITEIITRKELQNLVSELIGMHPDLMEGFNAFVERCEDIDGFLAWAMKKEDKEREHRHEIDAANYHRHDERSSAMPQMDKVEGSSAILQP